MKSQSWRGQQLEHLQLRRLCTLHMTLLSPASMTFTRRILHSRVSKPLPKERIRCHGGIDMPGKVKSRPAVTQQTTWGILHRLSIAPSSLSSIARFGHAGQYAGGESDISGEHDDGDLAAPQHCKPSGILRRSNRANACRETRGVCRRAFAERMETLAQRHRVNTWRRKQISSLNVDELLFHISVTWRGIALRPARLLAKSIIASVIRRRSWPANCETASLSCLSATSGASRMVSSRFWVQSRCGRAKLMRFYRDCETEDVVK